MTENGVKHIKSSPYHLASNGEKPRDFHRPLSTLWKQQNWLYLTFHTMFQKKKNVQQYKHSAEQLCFRYHRDIEVHSWATIWDTVGRCCGCSSNPEWVTCVRTPAYLSAVHMLSSQRVNKQGRSYKNMKTCQRASTCSALESHPHSKPGWKKADFRYRN